MESTVMISSLLCNILIGCFCIVVLSCLNSRRGTALI